MGSVWFSSAVEKRLNDVIEKIEVVEGDGSVGTVLKLLFDQVYITSLYPADSERESTLKQGSSYFDK